MVGTAGRKTQLWIDPPRTDGSVGVHIWNYGKKRQDFVTTASHLRDSLDDALAIAREWLND
jgi:hypothetical protein